MRRKPKQVRAKRMVDDIIQAGLQCVAKNGLDGTTTRHIADEAGISVGTLYQYYDDKEAVYQAMIEKARDEIVQSLLAVTPQIVQIDFRSGVLTILHEFSHFLEKDKGRYLKVFQYVGHFEILEHIKVIETQLVQMASMYIMRHPNEIAPEKMQVMIYIIMNSGISTLIRYLSDPAPQFSREALMEGLADMAAACIKGDA
ncbi:hypothetical protein A9Q81_10305 [Gammaproteobacteria bacterium 42_54_T18]|nr:hypothetical protein A9Q81_10305 [Gammaproteobacteria bacterium 42_54_T18]